MIHKKRSMQGLAIVLAVFLGLTVLLYGIGAFLSIEWLMLKINLTASNSGFDLTLGSLIPPIIGLIAAFVGEQIYLRRKMRTAS
ncbi:hypothetical protein JCM19046_4239 [Bacillus sp. JCM 19046]|nr:hypothetical protein JCM19045_119 [Bacillus sp. JCM 19045]GAF19579.1 hypothetical protein JCM19046_4239 [Bacillus sp. JCM 19046]